MIGGNPHHLRVDTSSTLHCREAMQVTDKKLLSCARENKGDEHVVTTTASKERNRVFVSARFPASTASLSFGFGDATQSHQLLSVID